MHTYHRMSPVAPHQVSILQLELQEDLQGQQQQQQLQQQQLMETAALSLLLQHPSMCCQRTVCSLLCVSKGMQAAVKHACSGVLFVSLNTIATAESSCTNSSSNSSSSSGGSSSPGRVASRAMHLVESFAAWMARHGALVQHLAVRMDGQQPAALRTAALLAQALQQAAASEASWRLQSCSLAGLPGSCLMPWLPPHHLTRLELGCEALPAPQQDVGSPAGQQQDVGRPAGQQQEPAALVSSSSALPGLCCSRAAACAALAGLTRLRSLLLQHAEADALLPAVSGAHHQPRLTAGGALPGCCLCRDLQCCLALIVLLQRVQQLFACSREVVNCMVARRPAHVVNSPYAAAAAAGLTSLTELRLVKMSVASVAALQALPAQQLARLSLSVSPNIHGWQRKQLQPQLGYLTALTQLCCTGEGLFAVQAHDVLPPALRALTGGLPAGWGAEGLWAAWHSAASAAARASSMVMFAVAQLVE
jgi:hypothetical protein